MSGGGASPTLNRLQDMYDVLTFTPSAGRNSRFFAIGDSITAHGNTFDAATGTALIDPLSFLAWATLLSGGKIRYAGAAGTGGYTIAQVAANHVATAIAADPGYCLVLAGTNDIGNGTTVKTMTDGLVGIYQALVAAGITPIICTPPPRSGDAGPNKNWAVQLNQWLSRYANANGYPFVDFYGALVDTTNGDYASGYASDGIHPTAAGAKVMGQAIATALASILAPAPFLNAVNTTTIGLGLFGGNGLFTTDTDADGLADGWAAALGSGATYALTTDSHVLGKYQGLTRGAADVAIKPTVGMPLIAGHRISVAIPVAATVKAFAGAFDVRLMTHDGVKDLFSLSGFTEDVPAGSVFAGDFTVPAGLASDSAILQVAAKTAASSVVKVAQPTIVDLDGVVLPNLSISNSEIHDGTRGAAVSGDGKAVPDSSFGVWKATTNRVDVLDFEKTGLTGWTLVDANASVTATLDATLAKFGLKSLKMVNANGNEDDYEFVNVSGLSANTKYAVSVWVSVTAFTQAAILNRGLYAYDTANPGATQQTATITAATSGFVRLTVVVTMTASPGSLQVRLHAPKGTVYYDGLVVEANPIATPYPGPAVANRSAALMKSDSQLAALLRSAQGAIAARVRPQWTSVAAAGLTQKYVGQLYLDANNAITCYFDPTTGLWTLDDRSGGTTATSTKAGTHAPDQACTVIYKWNAGGSSIALDGSAFTTPVARPAGTWTPGTFYIGSDPTHTFDGELLWMLAFDDPSNIDPAAAFLNSDTDPTSSNAPAGCRAVIPFVSTAYTLL